MKKNRWYRSGTGQIYRTGTGTSPNLLVILSHLLLSLFKTCPTDFDDTLI